MERDKDDGDGTYLFDIDIHRLEKEWVDHVHHYHKRARRLADANADNAAAKTELKEAEEDLKDVEADLDIRVRDGRIQHGLDKLTEGAVANIVRLHPERKKSRQKVSDARKKVDQTGHVAGLCKAEVDALDHKKKALEDMVFLWSRDYFASPREKYRDAVRDRQQKDSDEYHAARARRRREETDR